MKNQVQAAAADSRSIWVEAFRLIKELIYKWVFSGPVPFEVTPVHHLRSIPDGEFNWESLGDDPHFVLVPPEGRFPSGWCRLTCELDSDLKHPLTPVLYVDDGDGFKEATTTWLPAPIDGKIRTLIRLPDVVRGIRIDPCTVPARIKVGLLSLRELAKIEVILRAAWPHVRSRVTRPTELFRVVWNYFNMWRSGSKRALR